VDASGLNRLGQGHGWQHGGEPPGQHRLPRPRRAQEEDVKDVMGRTPASSSRRLQHPGPYGRGIGS
jgi:hypothetical protein